ncbi:alpha-sarcoglycan [Clupea harengus]|uniref:Alpha-sarcoglycan n=1 Tax=Clupea harengus TaxID=7950 RepID=A0A6P3W9L6_CLUHA|nr:alpha-sarcoglycan [Clupea harengus]
MAAPRHWALCLAVCVASFSVAQATKNAPVGQFFVYELQREVYQADFHPVNKIYGQVPNDPIVFKCNKQFSPDLPGWLRYTQRHAYDNGFLYGTPMDEDKGKNIIEIIAINRQSSETFEDFVIINVVPRVKLTPFQAEFFLPRREIETVLPSSVQYEIKQDVQKMWGVDDLEFVNITSALDQGGRVPLPLPGYFEGVYVKLGSEAYFSPCLQGALSPQHGLECEALSRLPGKPFLKVSTDCSNCAVASNCMEWCRSTLIDLSKPTPPPPAPTMGPGILEPAGEFDPPEDVSPRDFFPDYIVTVIFPFALALILLLLLSYVMCCRREGLDKRDAMTPELQLYHHHTIVGNTSELRDMAGTREGVPPPLSTLPMFSTRTGQRVPAMQRAYQPDSIPLIMAQQEPNVDTLPRK